MFDAATAHLFAAALGYDKFEMRKRFGMVGFPMVETAAKFIAPSRYGEVVTIESFVSRFGRSSFGITHRLFRGSGISTGAPAETPAIEATETRVWAAADPDDPERIRGVPIPAEVIEALSRPGTRIS